MAQIDDLTKDIVELQTQVQSITTMSGKLDTAIEKLTDVSASIKSMLAVHEEKINRAEDIDDELFSQIESRRRELTANTKELRDCISSLSQQIKQQERFKWVLIGGAMAVGFILSNMKILDKLF
mgnify:CR=1 FL=1